ncbi:uncharacterized protein LOC116353974 [Oncorhynchus kisutch]|uniref:uncharacterized protein LOC116353974 n=1 Tax=Oncorhynchus kisutch TaxID=8019 RepID=UPI0012DECAD1|nr:uncharacterized protein LOC116353974 [Oncorhynchus kisutch]
MGPLYHSLPMPRSMRLPYGTSLSLSPYAQIHAPAIWGLFITLSLCPDPCACHMGPLYHSLPMPRSMRLPYGTSLSLSPYAQIHAPAIWDLFITLSLCPDPCACHMGPLYHSLPMPRSMRLPYGTSLSLSPYAQIHAPAIWDLFITLSLCPDPCACHMGPLYHSLPMPRSMRLPYGTSLSLSPYAQIHAPAIWDLFITLSLCPDPCACHMGPLYHSLPMPRSMRLPYGTSLSLSPYAQIHAPAIWDLFITLSLCPDPCACHMGPLYHSLPMPRSMRLPYGTSLSLSPYAQIHAPAIWDLFITLSLCPDPYTCHMRVDEKSERREAAPNGYSVSFPNAAEEIMFSLISSSLSRARRSEGHVQHLLEESCLLYFALTGSARVLKEGEGQGTLKIRQLHHKIMHVFACEQVIQAAHTPVSNIWHGMS